MAHGGSWQGPMRLSAMELGPFKVTRTNIPRRRFLSVETRVAGCLFSRAIRTEPFFGLPGHFLSRISYSMQRCHRGGSILP